VAELIAQIVTGATVLVLIAVVYQNLTEKINQKVDRAYCKPTHDAAARSLARIELAVNVLDSKIDDITTKMAVQNGEAKARREGGG
jgi:CBS-domain-containing membrane protein